MALRPAARRAESRLVFRQLGLDPRAPARTAPCTRWANCRQARGHQPRVDRGRAAPLPGAGHPRRARDGAPHPDARGYVRRAGAGGGPRRAARPARSRAGEPGRAVGRATRAGQAHRTAAGRLRARPRGPARRAAGAGGRFLWAARSGGGPTRVRPAGGAWRTRTCRRYATADVYAHSSRYEGAKVLVEALAAGTPVAATRRRRGGHRAPRETGLLADHTPGRWATRSWSAAQAARARAMARRAGKTSWPGSTTSASWTRSPPPSGGRSSWRG